MTSQPTDAHPVPRVSVVMTVYNGAAHLAEAIDSVIAQTMADFEFLIHDDGSTDTTLEILRAYEARDPRVRVSTAPNRGIAASVNELIRRARAPLIARFDADDICLPERFERQLPAFERNPGLVALGTNYLFADERGNVFMKSNVHRDHARMDAQNLNGGCTPHQPTAMIRKASLTRVGSYDESLQTSEDLDLWLKLAEIGEIANLRDHLLVYRVHDGSVGSTKQTMWEENVRRVCQRAWDRRGVAGEITLQKFRPDESRASRLEFALRYGWAAWQGGYRAAWRSFALKSIRIAPLSPAAWKLLVFGALRRARGGELKP